MQGASVHKIIKADPSRVTANRLGALRFRLVLVMIASYLGMMAFLIHSARHPTQIAIVAPEFSPAMIALAICMAFSVLVTGLFVLVEQGD